MFHESEINILKSKTAQQDIKTTAKWDLAKLQNKCRPFTFEGIKSAIKSIITKKHSSIKCKRWQRKIKGTAIAKHQQIDSDLKELKESNSKVEENYGYEEKVTIHFWSCWPIASKNI